MRSPALVPIVVLCALVLPTVGASAQGPPPFTDEWRRQALELAEQYAMFGAFALERGELQGAFVSLEIDKTTGVLLNVTVEKPVGAVLVFRSITVNPAAAGSVSVDGSQFHYANSFVRVSVHNNPTVGLVHTAISAPVAVTFEISSDVAAVQEGFSIYLSAPGVRGRIASLGGTLSLAGAIATVNLPGGAASAFRVMLEDDEGPAGRLDQSAILDAFGEGLVGAESFLLALEGAILSDDIAYLPITLSASLVQPGIVHVLIASDLPSGRALVLNINAGVLGGRHQEPLTVTLDGREVPSTGSADEALHPGAARYHVSAASAGVVVEVFVPAFSSHALVLSVPELLPLLPRDPPGFAALGAAIAAVFGAIALAIRREKAERRASGPEPESVDEH